MAIDTTARVFDQFYEIDIQINPDQYEIVYSFFIQYCDTTLSAASFTSSLFLISSKTGVNVLDLLDTFETGDALKVNLTMAYYLNTISNKTVMFGVNNVIAPNNLVQRNIIQ
jgi:hypothetical protein